MNYIIIYYDNLFYIHYIFIYIYIYIYIYINIYSPFTDMTAY